MQYQCANSDLMCGTQWQLGRLVLGKPLTQNQDLVLDKMKIESFIHTMRDQMSLGGRHMNPNTLALLCPPKFHGLFQVFSKVCRFFLRIQWFFGWQLVQMQGDAIVMIIGKNGFVEWRNSQCGIIFVFLTKCFRDYCRGTGQCHHETASRHPARWWMLLKLGNGRSMMVISYSRATQLSKDCGLSRSKCSCRLHLGSDL